MQSFFLYHENFVIKHTYYKMLDIGTFSFFLIFKEGVWTIMWTILFSGHDIY